MANFNLEERAEIREVYGKYFTDLLFMELGEKDTKFFSGRDVSLGDLLSRRDEIQEVISANIEDHIDCILEEDIEDVLDNVDDNLYLCTPIITIADELDENGNPINSRYVLDIVVTCSHCEGKDMGWDLFSLSAFLGELNN